MLYAVSCTTEYVSKHAVILDVSPFWILKAAAEVAAYAVSGVSLCVPSVCFSLK